MNNSLYTHTTLILALALAFLPFHPLKAQKLSKENQIIVAFYGRPGTASLGVLGQHDIEQLSDLIKKQVKAYEEVTQDAKVIPAFDIIYGLAAAEPGRDGSYIINLPEHKLMPYIEKANHEDFLLFIDLQLGNRTPLESVEPVLKYLSHKNVHLAIDPEFEVKGLDVAPGKKIGSITGEDVNAVQDAMQQYLKANNIKEDKFLMVHNFTHNMVKGKSSVKPYEQIHLIMNLDGHGSPELKINIYNGLYTSEVAEQVDGGFKLFFKEDHPMMSPRSVLGMEEIKGHKIKHMPRFINYQ